MSQTQTLRFVYGAIVRGDECPDIESEECDGITVDPVDALSGENPHYIVFYSRSVRDLPELPASFVHDVPTTIPRGAVDKIRGFIRDRKWPDKTPRWLVLADYG